MNPSNRKYWNPEMETMDREALEAFKIERLQRQLAHVYENSPFYRKLYYEAGFDPHEIRTMVDFRRHVPVFTKDMIRQFRDQTGDPLGGMLCVSMDQVRWAGSSTGTSGAPTYTAMSEDDLSIHGEWGARILWQAGVRPGGKAHIAAPPYAKGSQTFQHGAEKLGCVYLGEDLFPSEAPRIVMTQNLFAPDTYFVMTTALLTMFNGEMERQKLDSRDVWSSCKSIMWGGEPLTAVTRKRLEDYWQTDLLLFQGPGSDFGLPPMECREGKQGGHVYEDLYMVEVIDPVTKGLLGPGEMGELVWTHLQDQATPFVRFNTEDFGMLLDDPCPCGRTGMRLVLMDRPEYAVCVCKKNVFSIQVREVLESFSETEEGVFQFVKYSENMDCLRLRVGYRPEITRDVPQLKARLENAVAETLGLKTEIEPALKEEFMTVAHKFVRVLDLTENGR